MNTVPKAVAAVVATCLLSACATTEPYARTEPRHGLVKDEGYVAAVEERAAMNAGRVEIHWINPPYVDVDDD